MILDKFIAKLSWREKLFVVAMTVILAVLLVDVFVITAVVDRLKVLAEQTRAAALTLKVNYAMLQIRPEVTKQYDAVRKSLELPLTDEEIIEETQSRYLSPLLQTNNIVVELMKPLPSSLPAVGSAQEYLIELTGLEGDIVNILEFMDGLNHLPGLYRVAQVHLKPGDRPQRVKGSIAVARLVLRTQTEEAETEPVVPTP